MLMRRDGERIIWTWREDPLVHDHETFLISLFVLNTRCKLLMLNLDAYVIIDMGVHENLAHVLMTKKIK
jgi:hypothetical protein